MAIAAAVLVGGFGLLLIAVTIWATDSNPRPQGTPAVDKHPPSTAAAPAKAPAVNRASSPVPVPTPGSTATPSPEPVLAAIPESTPEPTPGRTNIHADVFSFWDDRKARGGNDTQSPEPRVPGWARGQVLFAFEDWTFLAPFAELEKASNDAIRATLVERDRSGTQGVG